MKLRKDSTKETQFSWREGVKDRVRSDVEDGEEGKGKRTERKGGDRNWRIGCSSVLSGVAFFPEVRTRNYHPLY